VRAISIATVSATFHPLPAASFVVNRPRARDAALLAASAEMKWPNSWAVAGTFEGEFSDVTRKVRRQRHDAVRLVQCREL
jgi:uncharacterized protein with beta-barrel porin domain